MYLHHIYESIIEPGVPMHAFIFSFANSETNPRFMKETPVDDPNKET